MPSASLRLCAHGCKAKIASDSAGVSVYPPSWSMKHLNTIRS